MIRKFTVQFINNISYKITPHNNFKFSDFEKMIRSLKSCKTSLCYLNFNLNLINSMSRATYLTTLLPSLSNLHTLRYI